MTRGWREAVMGAFKKRSPGTIELQLGELARGCRQLGAPRLAGRFEELRQKYERGIDIEDELQSLLRDNDRFEDMLEHASDLHAHCASRGWTDLAVEWATVIATWDSETDPMRVARMQRVNAGMQRRLAEPLREERGGPERIVERQVLVQRCRYCTHLTPVDLSACRECGAKL